MCKVPFSKLVWGVCFYLFLLENGWMSMMCQNPGEIRLCSVPYRLVSMLIRGARKITGFNTGLSFNTKHLA